MIQRPLIRRAGASALALLGGLAIAIVAIRRHDRVPEPDTAVRWTSGSCIQWVAVDGDTLHLATRGALLRIGPDASVDRINEGEAEWRSTSEHAAVGVRHFATHSAGRWHVYPLPDGEEGFAVAESESRIWVGHSRGVTMYAVEGREIREFNTIGAVHNLVSDSSGVVAFGERGVLRIAASGSVARIPAPGLETPIRVCTWNGTIAAAGSTSAGTAVEVYNGGQWKRLVSPESTSPVAALHGFGRGLVLAVAGDGMFQFDDSQWAQIAAPSGIAGDVSCIAEQRGQLLVGTWSHGAWVRGSHGWEQIGTGDRLPAGDIQAVTEWHQRVWIATFDRGVWSWNGKAWRRWSTSEGLSSNAPRAFAALSDRLLVRHASGKVDVFDENHWRKNVLAGSVPRPWAASLSRDGVIGGWGCLTRPDGQRFEQTMLPRPLSAETITCTAGGAFMVGTARTGLFHRTGGVPTPLAQPVDGWITAVDGGRNGVVAGSYSGEAVYRRSESSAPVTVTLPDSVTAVCIPDRYPPIAACRSGIWIARRAGWVRYTSATIDGLEPQALCAGARGLWIGGRNGLAFVPWADLDATAL